MILKIAHGRIESRSMKKKINYDMFS